MSTCFQKNGHQYSVVFSVILTFTKGTFVDILGKVVNLPPRPKKKRENQPKNKL